MKNLSVILLLFCLSSGLSLFSGNIEQQQNPTLVIRGRVLGGDTNQPLVNASITVQHENVSSVTNQDGYFSIRIPASAVNSKLVIRHLGYENKEIPINTLNDIPNNHIVLQVSSIELGEVLVVSGDG